MLDCKAAAGCPAALFLFANPPVALLMSAKVPLRRFGLLAVVLFASAVNSTCACAVETVVFRDKANDSKSRRTVVGELLVEAVDGGVMLLADDGRIWTAQPEQIISRKSNDEKLIPITDDQMEKRMLAELPAGFKVYRTTNYLIVHNTNERYVRIVGTKFEQLYRAFFNYWKNKRWKLPQPRFPLVALVLADKDDFLKYATADIGDTARSVIGYYHISRNQLVTFNMPNLERNIATIIHEGTHQLAYNCGMQTRFADNPMWVSEGLAMYFESPDTSGPRGWRGIGRVNQVNLARWNRYLRNRPAESLATLLADDMRFRNTSTAENAYGEAWAMTFFLIRTRDKEYTAYMKKLSEGKPQSELSARERIQAFEEAFDTTLVDLDKAFVAYMRRVR